MQRVEEIDFTKYRPVRAAIVPIALDEVLNTEVIGLGIDRLSGDLSDFGGSVRYNSRKMRDNNALEGALREYREETLDILPQPLPEMLRDAPVICTPTSLTIFVKDSRIRPRASVRAFQELLPQLSVRKERYREMDGIVWMTVADLRDVLDNRHEHFRVWEPVRRVLKEAFQT